MATAEPSTTPNPDAMKFTLDVRLDRTIDVRTADAAAGDPLVERLMAIDGVTMVFGTADFITVGRDPEGDWSTITPAVQAAVAELL